MTTVGFVGLGKLGLPCAEVMAEHYTVNGYDINPNIVSGTVIVTTLEHTVTAADIIFVAIQTPHDPLYDGSTPSHHLEPRDFDYTMVKDCLDSINKLARPDQLVVLISTTLPGTVRTQLRKHISVPRFIYNPYLIAMGSVKWDMVNPEMVIIGTEDGNRTADANDLNDFYRPIIAPGTYCSVGTWDEAEAIKIFYNTFISMKVSMVNMIQDVAMKNGNMNVDVVTDALKQSTKRITGPKYMTAGMGDAGPCHPRDNIALRHMAAELNLGYDLFDTIMTSREVQAKNLAQFLYSTAVDSDFPIYIHGKAYKPGVDILDGSYSLLVGYYLEQLGKPGIYIDPMTADTLPELPVLGVVLLAHNAGVTYGYTGTEHNNELYCELQSGCVVVDPWRTYPKINTDGVQVIHYGNTRPE